MRLAVERLVRSAATQAAPPAAARATGASARARAWSAWASAPSDPGLSPSGRSRCCAPPTGCSRPSTAATPSAGPRRSCAAPPPTSRSTGSSSTIAEDDDGAGRGRSRRPRPAIVDALDRGEVVAFVTLGDPNVYSTFPALARLVAAQRPAVPVADGARGDGVPGAGGPTGTVLVEGDEQLAVLAARRRRRRLSPPARRRRAHGRDLQGRAATCPRSADGSPDHDRLDGAVVGEMLGLPGGRSVPVATVADRPGSYLATVVVPRATDGTARDLLRRRRARARPTSSPCGALDAWPPPTSSSGRPRSSPRPCSSTAGPTSRSTTPRR